MTRVRLSVAFNPTDLASLTRAAGDKGPALFLEELVREWLQGNGYPIEVIQKPTPLRAGNTSHGSSKRKSVKGADNPNQPPLI